MKRFILISLICLVFANVPAFADEFLYAKASAASLLYNAGSVLVMDARTGVVLYENEGFNRRFPASITKIMTALLVLEQVGDLNERVVFSENAVDLPWYAGRMGIVEGESMSVLEALYGIMLPSANDVARALAEHVSGSVPEFVTKMNFRAEQLGAYNTRFINPCGLPGDGQFATAYDLALIMKEAIKHPLFNEIISTPYFYLPLTEYYDEARQIRNSNIMVRPTHMGFDDRVIGGKTGFTIAAQHTLVSYAAYEGLEIIISLLYTSPRGAIFTDTAALMNFIFEGFYFEEPEYMPEDFSDEFSDKPEYETNNETETIYDTFAYTSEPEISPDNQPPSIAQARSPALQEVSGTEAAVVASLSLALAATALFFVRFSTHFFLRNPK